MYPPEVSGVGAQVADQNAHLLGVSGVGVQAGDVGAHPPMVSDVGPRPLIGARTHLGTLGLCAWAAGR